MRPSAHRWLAVLRFEKFVDRIDQSASPALLAGTNFQRSRLGDQVIAIQGSVPHKLVMDSYYDLVLANISARAISERAESLSPTLKAGGYLVASGIISDQRDTAEDGLKSSGFAIVEACIKEDWVTLICSRG